MLSTVLGGTLVTGSPPRSPPRTGCQHRERQYCLSSLQVHLCCQTMSQVPFCLHDYTAYLHHFVYQKPAVFGQQFPAHSSGSSWPRSRRQWCLPGPAPPQQCMYTTCPSKINPLSCCTKSSILHRATGQQQHHGAYNHFDAV